MHLNFAHLPYPVPITAYEPPEHPQGEAIRIDRPTHDPQSIGLMPGMEGTLTFDDGRVYRFQIGSTWTSHQAGGELRITIEALPSDLQA